KRKMSDSLVEWKNSKNRMPLIVNGARQVGKTYIIEQFGKEHFENYVLLNMEMEGTLRGN
ncbi:AAA family ATPase, partial [Candidatus Symbiothrix dinenymphae]|uniref:AAA family ATPase n=1 Tax=Candidatus Symbiothrix dinenymphae TaxID=467085 RepID=UPI000A6D3FAD